MNRYAECLHADGKTFEVAGVEMNASSVTRALNPFGVKMSVDDKDKAITQLDNIIRDVAKNGVCEVSLDAGPVSFMVSGLLMNALNGEYDYRVLQGGHGYLYVIDTSMIATFNP